MRNDMENNMLISIIMPVYNSDKYLKAAVNSVLNQTYSNFELLLIDDGSTDCSPELCDNFEQHDHRIRTIHKKNGGVCSARNLGINESKGKYITFIDNDDLYEPRFLEIMVKQLKLHHVDMVKCGRKNITVNTEGKIVGTRVSTWDSTQMFDKSSFIENYYDLKQSGILSSVWNGLYRKEFIISNEIVFNEKFKHGNEDVYFNICCFLKCISIIVVHDVLYEHFYRDSHSTSLKYHEDQIVHRLETIVLEQKLIELLKDSRYYELIMMENIRVSFKLLSIAKDKPSRDKGIKMLTEELPLEEFENYKLFNYNELPFFEKIELFLIKNHYYYLYFKLQTLKHR